MLSKFCSIEQTLKQNDCMQVIKQILKASSNLVDSRAEEFCSSQIIIKRKKIKKNAFMMR